MTNTADSRNAMTENVPVEWGDSSEVQRQHEMELREARARVTQMEKTMKWWADCCGNWREKWAKVRNDRNKAREEIKQLRVQLATSKKEIEDFKNKNSLLESEIAQIKQDNDKKTSPSTDGLNNENNEDGLVTKSDLFIPDSMPANDKQNNEIQQQISILKLRLEEAKTTIAAERSEKNAVHKTLEKLRQELEEIREKCDELRAAKKDAIRELLTAQEEHRAELRLVNNSVNEEVAARESLEKKLCDLRVELEKLQAENAAEWGKRERLETEKITMDRENKKLRSELLDLQDRMERKGRPISNSDLEIRSLQQEIADKLKENNDLKHSNNKLKKMLFEANTEMGHAHRRAEQYEGEVKTLRTRVEELKRELCAVEDELDSVSNQARRFQRINEEMRVEMAKFQSSLLNIPVSNGNSKNSDV